MTPAVLFGRLMAKARLRHLQLMVRIAELDSLQKAAVSVHMSQPGATHALAELEAILDAPLFERHARGMRLSAMGAALLPLVRGALAQLQAGAELAASLHAGAAGTVRIAAIAAASSSLLAELLPPFTQTHSDVAVVVLQSGAEDLLKLIEERAVDLLACREPAQLPADFEFLPLLDDQYVVVCGPQHPLASRTRVTNKQLGSASWIFPPPAGITAQEFDRLCQTLNITPDACWVSVRSVLLTMAMVQQRDLLVLIPRTAVVQLLEAGLIVELRCSQEITPSLPPLGLVAPKNLARGAAVARFIEHARSWSEQRLA